MRCQHCYDDIREARITEYAAVDLTEGQPLPSAWLTEATASPFCLRAVCWSDSHGQITHEIRHAPMPQV